jgi:hypothetical protein
MSDDDGFEFTTLGLAAGFVVGGALTVAMSSTADGLAFPMAVGLGTTITVALVVSEFQSDD